MCAIRILSTMALLLVPVVCGCGSSDRQPVYPVRGTIRLEGKAIPGGGSIAFLPMEKQAGKTAGGEIREDGTYVLTTYSPGDGSMAGYFRVIITQASTVEPREAPPDGQPIPKGGLVGMVAAAEDIIPTGYSDGGASPLRATVEPRSNEINFDLQRKLGPVEGAAPTGVASRSTGNQVQRGLVILFSGTVCFNPTPYSEGSGHAKVAVAGIR